jgi:hypothetical protein
MSPYARTETCPNCRRDFHPMRYGIRKYCPECWRAWGRNDGSFEAREVTLRQWADALDAKRKERQ